MAVGGNRGVWDKGSGTRKHRQDSPREALKPLRFPGFTCFPHRGCWHFRALAHMRVPTAAPGAGVAPGGDRSRGPGVTQLVG